MNKVMMIGNLTSDPTMHTTQNNASVCSFGLAVNDRKRMSDVTKTLFFRVSAWRGLGDACMQYLQKGRKCCVVGSLSTREYEAGNGEKRMSLEIQAEDVEFLPSADALRRAQAPAPQMYAPPDAGFTQVDEDELPF